MLLSIQLSKDKISVKRRFYLYTVNQIICYKYIEYMIKSTPAPGAYEYKIYIHNLSIMTYHLTYNLCLIIHVMLAFFSYDFIVSTFSLNL